MYALTLILLPLFTGVLFSILMASEKYRGKFNNVRWMLVFLLIVGVISVVSTRVILRMSKASAKETLLFITQVNMVKMKFTIDGKLNFCGKPNREELYKCVQILQGGDGLSTENSTNPVEFIEVAPDQNWSLFEKEHYFVARVQNY